MVSVCIPAYNSAGTIIRSVDSVLAQDVPLEIIVVDDCSTDETQEILRKKYGTLSNFRLLQSPQNQGAAGSRNMAVAAAAGEYIAFLDADDAWAAGKLKAQLQLIRQTGCVLCCTGRVLVTPQGTVTGRVIGVPERITYTDLLRTNCISCSSVLIRREAALRFPMEHEDSHEDYITWLKVLREYGDACGINRPLLLYTLSASGKSGSKLKSAGMTFRAYRYMGFSVPKSMRCFTSYAWNGVWKYLSSYMRRMPEDGTR